MKIPRILTNAGWNQRPLRFSDFEIFCHKQKIVVKRTPTRLPGLYTVIEGQPGITLSEYLSPLWLDFTAWHEAGHYALHHPATNLFGQPNKSKTEREANIIAACALIPQPMLLENDFDEIAEYTGLPREIILFRAQVWQLHKF